jgi:HD-like signal output (HDOD) protein
VLGWLERGAERERRHVQVRDTLVRFSSAGTLPTLPQATTAALALAREPETDIDPLCTVIRTDVGLAACVLRLANSAAYGRRRPATTLQAAIVTIGIRKTCDIVVAAGARRLYGAAGQYAGALWRHALTVGIATEELARMKGHRDPDTTFVPGLLHDVGRIAFFVVDPLSFGKAVRREERTARERRRYGLDHAEAGAILVGEWGFGVDHRDAIRWHHDPAQAEAGRELALLIDAADTLAHAVDLETDGDPPAEEFPEAHFAGVGLSARDGTDWIQRARTSFALHHAAFA